MKLLLVDPPQLFLEGRGATRYVQPLGLGYVGAVLAPHHDVRFLLPDTRAYVGDDPWGELERVVRDEAPDLVALTAVTALYPSARRFAELVKSIDAEIPVVLGGVHASTLPVDALGSAPNVDYVVSGEGEHTLTELVEAIEARRAGKRLDIGAIAGVTYRDDDGAIRRGPPRPSITDLDALPFPLRDHFVYDDDLHPALFQAVVTLRGCPYQCIYCAVPSSNDRRTRYRSAENVVDEIAFLVETYAIPNLFFHDSVFTLHRRRTVAICQGMIDRGLQIPFTVQTRTDRVDPELLALMKEAGCEQIFFGIESGDVESLARIRKKMPLDDIRDAVQWVRDLDMRASGFFMIGFPWETRDHMERTADFATSLDLDTVSLFSATPLPGTELWELAGGADMPDSIDFRTPQVNTTAMGDDEYGEIFERIKNRIDQFNREQMYRRLAASAPADAPINWLTATTTAS